MHTDIRTIVSLFAHQAGITPDSPAVTSGEVTVSYGQLHERSAALAHALFEAGVRAGDRVGVQLERSVHLVTALLAVMKAGAAYVPLDPGYPAERLDFIVADTGIDVVVAGDESQGLSGVQLIPVSARAAPAAPSPQPPGIEDIAYVIHTSGSTGRPKGVLVRHGNVVALLDATVSEFGFAGDDVWTLFHSFSFDFSVWEMWACLLTGGRLVVVPQWTARDPGEFHALLVRERVTVLNQTPSAFLQFLSAPAFSEGGLAVRLLVFGGESLNVRTLAPWFDRYPAARVENMYGITETTVHVSSRTVTVADVEQGTRSIGRPLPGWSMRLLDADGRPVAAGEVGEIHVGGAGVALGYLNRPGLTAERFLPDPAGTGALYRSGDRGRELPNGEFEHLGRLDDQVKIRGHRIELGEIRAALSEDPVVRAAVVVPRRDVNSDSVGIHAYVVTTGLAEFSGVRERLAARLPAYLVPDTLTRITELPLDPNGKVDKARLAAMTSSVAELHPSDSAVDPVAAWLSALWESVLGVPVTGHDNFFEVGGNSLLAARLANELAAAGMAVPMRELYSHSTLNSMADLLRSYPEVN